MLISAVCLALLVGGIGGYSFYSVRIDGLISQVPANWGESVEKANIRQVIVREAESFALWRALFANTALLGGLSALAFIWRRRLGWGAGSRFLYSVLGGLVTILLSALLFFPMSMGISALFPESIRIFSAPLIFFFLIAIVFWWFRRLTSWRGILFVLGSLMMLWGIWNVVYFSSMLILETTQEFILMFELGRLFSGGVALIGAVMGLVAVLFPERRGPVKTEFA